MMDHVSIGVSDYAAARRFYDTVLAALGLKALMAFPDQKVAGYGAPGAPAPFFWIGDAHQPDTQGQGRPLGSGPGLHLCFRAPSRAAVDSFYDTALRMGADDNGAPGLRPHYHANYYGAFVVDPDGWRLEAVCHSPETD
ncbi:VOC family protein [Elstera cyanobacteriorum]|uniref:VOC family protein n=1 Tax=Elstera cyanobacteriorum TaxID=2022747 RepID=UPI002356508A|nr:VOC family protein [Elstera cyanobacteriorum]MCK6443925.1 VOC family protein [Elstera cyanobacteriorum]